MEKMWWSPEWYNSLRPGFYFFGHFLFQRPEKNENSYPQSLEILLIPSAGGSLNYDVCGNFSGNPEPGNDLKTDWSGVRSIRDCSCPDCRIGYPYPQFCY